MCEAFISSDSASANTNVDTEVKKDAVNAEQSLGNVASNVPRPFVYISAEDIFRPVIPARYISTKREAEQGIERLISGNLRDRFRGVYIRPSQFYFTVIFFLVDSRPTAIYTIKPLALQVGMKC